MTPRLRKFLGLLALLLLIAVYAGAVVSLAPALLPGHWAVDLLVYAVAGVAWIYPAGRLIRWMQAADA